MKKYILAACAVLSYLAFAPVSAHAQVPCGPQFIQGRHGGTVVLGNRECGPRYPHNGARFYPDNRPQYGGQRYGYGSNYGYQRMMMVRHTFVVRRCIAGCY